MSDRPMTDEDACALYVVAGGTCRGWKALGSDAHAVVRIVAGAVRAEAVAEIVRLRAEVQRLTSAPGADRVSDDGHYKPTKADFEASRAAVSSLPEPMWGYLASLCRVTKGACWCGAHRPSEVCDLAAPVEPAALTVAQRCDSCDWTFGCFQEPSKCCKRPVQP
jgi:hypothetical protein